MPDIVYAMQFTGQAAPKDGSPGTLVARTTAPGTTIRSVAGPAGLEGAVESAGGGESVFESEVILTGETTFKESGRIAFGGNGNALRFSTVGEGHIAGSPDPKVSHGSVIWRVDGGEGQFEGATGLITSNFTLSDAGRVVDNHFGLIHLK